MNPHAWTVTALLVVTGLAPLPLSAVEVDPETAAQEEAAEQVDPGSPGRLTRELVWHTDLKAALAEAEQQKKLVFWVQLKGTIDGST